MNNAHKEWAIKADQSRATKEKEYIHTKRNILETCPYCNGSIKDRKIALYKGLIDSLYQIYCWCGKNRKHEFHTKDIRHLLGQINYTRFGDFVRFGGILYKPKINGKSVKALYGINMARAKEFFAGQRTIPLQITLDQITGEIIEETRGKVSDFPELYQLLKKDGMYDYDLPVQEALLK